VIQSRRFQWLELLFRFFFVWVTSKVLDPMTRHSYPALANPKSGSNFLKKLEKRMTTLTQS
jgi:hypothetical protein